MDDDGLFDKIKKLDFSRYSQKDKERLWEELNTKNHRPLLEHELEFAAAGTAEPKSFRCADCGSEIISNNGICRKCGMKQTSTETPHERRPDIKA